MIEYILMILVCVLEKENMSNGSEIMKGVRKVEPNLEVTEKDNCLILELAEEMTAEANE